MEQKRQKNINIKLTKMDCVLNLTKRFPCAVEKILDKDGKKYLGIDQHVFHNAKGASFGDSASFRLLPNGTFLMIAGQEKWDYNGEDFTLEEAQKEHQKSLDKLSKKNFAHPLFNNVPNSVVTVCFTSQEFTLSDIPNIPDNIIIIDRNVFLDYFGIFANRALLAVASKINPNFADIPHLMSLYGIGDVKAKNIVELRQTQPFKNFDDFYGRAQIHAPAERAELKRKTSFFPFDLESKRMKSTDGLY